jgi:group I intron endonuclease
MYIYGYKNIVNSKWYIGKSESKNKNRRHDQHVKHVTNNVKSQFYSAIRKYGWDAFERHILFECDTRNELNQKEKEFIQLYNSYQKGYNATLGGDGGDTFSSLSDIQKLKTNKKRSESLKKAWVRDRESRMQSFADTDYSFRQTAEYRKLQSDRCKQLYIVSDPDGNIFEFTGIEEMKQYFAKLNEGKSLSSPHRISPTNIAWRGSSKNWKRIK